MFLLAAAFLTAALSAVFGMAGGLLFMGACTLALPVASAMILHGATQATSNGVRALLLWRHVRAGVLLPYAAGALGACALLWPLRFVPDPPLVFLALGALPFVTMALRPRSWMDVERPGVAALAGVAVAGVQLVAGVGGPLLDVFFVQSGLGRREVVATKAATQVIAHLLKIGWFAGVAAEWPDGRLVVGAAVAATLGTAAGGRVLERLSDAGWRRATRWVLAGVGGVYLVRGLTAW